MMHFSSMRELKEAMAELPLLRRSAVGLDPRKTVVACHVSDLNEAVTFYRKELKYLPAFYVLDLPEGKHGQQQYTVHDFAELVPGMDIQLYFRQVKAPRLTPFVKMVLQLMEQGIENYGLERYGTELFYWRNKKAQLTEENWETILHFVNVLSDDDSQHTYMAICRSRLEAEPGFIPLAGYPQYFHPRVSVKPGDIVCEGGIDDGGSTLRFYEAMQQQGQIHAFEPVPESCKRLQTVFAPYTGIHLEAQALWKHTGRILLAGTHSSCSAHVSESDKQEANCACTSIDDYFASRTPPSVIKLDVEGAEREVLEGAQKNIRSCFPKLMISIYHGRRLDWIEIPAMMLEYDSSYSFYCGHHSPWYNESIVYAI